LASEPFAFLCWTFQGGSFESWSATKQNAYSLMKGTVIAFEVGIVFAEASVVDLRSFEA
jgi:hypothetical protein